MEVPKGQPPEDQKIRSLVFGPGNCTIPILAGWTYVFFLGPGGPFIDSDDKNLIWRTNGSFPAPNLEAKSVKGELAKLRQLSRAKPVIRPTLATVGHHGLAMWSDPQGLTNRYVPFTIPLPSADAYN